MRIKNKKKNPVLFAFTESRLIVPNASKINGLELLLRFINKALTNRTFS